MPLKTFLGLHRVSALQVDVRYPEVAIIMDSAYPLPIPVGLRRFEQRRTASLAVALLENAVNLTSLSVLRTSQLLVQALHAGPTRATLSHLRRLHLSSPNSQESLDVLKILRSRLTNLDLVVPSSATRCVDLLSSLAAQRMIKSLIDIREAYLPREPSSFAGNPGPLLAQAVRFSTDFVTGGHVARYTAVSLSLRMISTVDPTPAFWGELAPMAPRLRGFDIMLYAMQRDDIPAMPERFMILRWPAHRPLWAASLAYACTWWISNGHAALWQTNCSLTNSDGWESVGPGEKRAIWAIAIAHGLSLP
ncbi:predicted protein [Postia placenta Mad-698-R]|nr:predicted protein [Postia placenta Mad-698-R]